MRHLKSGRALGVKPAHRRAIMRNMVTSVLEHQRITTTVAKAKELRGPLDKMITLGKKGDLAARRQALAFVKSKAAMASLFGEFAERYAERNGGYSRIIRLGPRRGDGAAMAIVQLVGAPNDPFAVETKGKGGGRRRRRKVADEVAEEVTAKAEEKATAKAEAKPAEPEAAPAETEAPEPEAAPAETEAPVPEAKAAEAGDQQAAEEKAPKKAKAAAKAPKGKSAKTPKGEKPKAKKPAKPKKDADKAD